ncbi:Ig-like domain-containing protein [Flavobacterium cyanobacteriorum]|nr:T9SS type B sorting domain-containing protein [Flavobacterium cyanobacteriorum]
MKFFVKYLTLLFIGCFLPLAAIAQNEPPVLTAQGNQAYCPGGSWLDIATDFIITDPDDTGTSAVYVQIASGYVSAEDELGYTGTMPGLEWAYDPITAKAEIRRVDGQPLTYAEIIQIVKDVAYRNTAISPTPGVRTFSITLGDASYLPSTGHYYKFIPFDDISWSEARAAAAASTYYGIQGYLATITSTAEAQMVGEQTRVTGWIGGSDEETEGVWKWMGGPEAGTVFWNGAANGSTPNFAFWNTAEPNNINNEDYAHITARGVGVTGSWNDLPNAGSDGDYRPRGYVVEYGGMPGDPVINISASTVINVAPVVTATGSASCGPGALMLQASAPGAAIQWFDAPSGGTAIATGNVFTTSVLTSTTTFYAAVAGTCSTNRVAVTATINDVPAITVPTTIITCEGSPLSLQATAPLGTVSWFNVASGGVPIATGPVLNLPAVNAGAVYYAEVVDGNCVSPRKAIQIVVNQPPQVEDEQVSFCEGSSVLLDAGIAGATYSWQDNSTGMTLTVTSPGIYTVTITLPSGCSSVKTFTVTQRQRPLISGVGVEGTTIIVTLVNADIQNYLFSVDGLNFQASPIFYNVPAGLRTLTAKEVGGCGTATEDFVVFIVPKFFTPNNDSTNDVFYVPGLVYFPKATLTIFDRYGKVITRLSRGNQYWDGTLNNQKLPATDYWYVISFNNGLPEIKGHFSLLR